MAIAGLVAAGTLSLQQRAIDRAHADFGDWAAQLSNRVIAPELRSRSLDKPLAPQAASDFASSLRGDVVPTSHEIERIRIWAPDGILILSTDSRDRRGSRTSDSASIRNTVRGESLAAKAAGGQISAFVGVRPAGSAPIGVVEVDANADRLDAAAGKPFSLARAGAESLAGLFVLLALFPSLARRRGKPAVTGEKPRDAHPTEIAHSPADHSPSELSRMQQKLQHTAESRKALEEQLDQLRAQITTTRQEAEARLAPVAEALRAAQAQLSQAGVSAATTALEAKIGELKEALTTARAHASELESRMGDMASQTSESQIIAERSQTEAELARSNLAAVEHRAKHAEAALGEVEGRQADAEALNAELRADIGRLEEELRWARAQQTETQPILQEAATRAHEEQERAQDLFDKAGRAEERVAGAEERAKRAEAKLAALESRLGDESERDDRSIEREAVVDELRTSLGEAEERAASAEARAQEAVQAASGSVKAEAKIRRLERALESARSRARELAHPVDEDHASRLDATERSAQKAADELAALRTEVASLGDQLKGRDVPGRPAAGLQSEIERLARELARTLERAHAAEERGTRLEAEIAAISRREEFGEVPPSRDPIDLAPNPVEADAGDGLTPDAGRDEGLELARAEGPSLRSRLAQTAARKKSRAPEEGSGTDRSRAR